MAYATLHMGIDDTDSPAGMCTTYLGFKIAGALRKEGAEFLDYPRLVRLNPNIPWKTRGNGAVGMKIRTSDPAKIRKIAVDLLCKHSEVAHGANPAIVFYEGDALPPSVREFSRMALWRLIERGAARRVIQRHGLDSFYMGNGQGLVGATGAVGYEFDDSTVELLYYRKRSRLGTPREIHTSEVARIQDEFPDTFSSYDPARRRVLISPRGPDPVLYGIRGENPRSLLGASAMITLRERPDGYMIFRSNQGTSDHLANELFAGDLEPYASGTIRGTVSRQPEVLQGGHLVFSISARNGEIACALYKESGLTGTLADLSAGDGVIVGGGVRRASRGRPRVLNLEFVRIVRLAAKSVLRNPLCDICNKRMKSKGRGQGFECAGCGRRSDFKHEENTPRSILPRLYLPVLSSQRHLTRPRRRQGRRNRVIFDDLIPWFCDFKI